MRRWTMYLLPFMTACMSGANPVVLSDSSTSSGGGIVGVPPVVEGPLGHEGFALLLNDERGEAGVVAVVEDARLSAAAQMHAQDMVTYSYLSHVDREGGTVGDRALEVGYDWRFIAENIAQGFNSNAAVISAWMGSGSHQANMLDGRAEDFGLGRVNNTWVLMLGAELEPDGTGADTTQIDTVDSGE